MRFHPIPILLAFCAVLGCSSDGNRPARQEGVSDDSLAVTVETFEGRGLVRSVMPNREYIVVHHDDIPGFMSAMEMPFALKDTSLATGVAAGDSIRFTVEVDGPYIHITDLAIIR